MVILRRTNMKEMTEAEKEDSVIVKVGNKWRILKKNRKDYWDAEYDTKEKAQAALRAYWANKREYHNWLSSNKVEVTEKLFFKDWNSGFLAKLTSFLIAIFGPTVYFDHENDNSIELYYKGQEVAEMIYNPTSEEVVIMPDDTDLAPVSFYDTSEYEIKNYLSDLLLGDLDK